MPFQPSIYPVKITATRPDGLTTVLNTTMTVQGSTDDVSYYLGVATETNTALPVTQLGGDVTAELGIASETDSANSVTASIADHIEVDLGVATETNTALHAVVPPDELGIATETSAANTVTPFIAPQIQVVLGIATESNVALPVVADAGAPIIVNVGIATEANDAPGITVSNVSQGSRFASLTLISRNGVIQTNLTSLSWAWFDAVDPANFSEPVAKGQTEVTDATGELEVNITGTSLNTGQKGSLVLRSDNGQALGAYNLEVY